MWTINVREPYFSQIECGQKTVEGRLFRGKFAEFKVGDAITILCGGKILSKTISDIIIYENIDKFLDANLVAAMPGKTPEEAKNEYVQIYPDISEYEMMAIVLI